MKKILILVAFVLAIGISSAEARYQTGYYKPSTGKYVSGHFKTNSNSTRWDNYSTKGNINPYTGKKGYKSPYKNSYPKTTIKAYKPYKPRRYKY
jgi:hypothetical protein